MADLQNTSSASTNMAGKAGLVTDLNPSFVSMNNTVMPEMLLEIAKKEIWELLETSHLTNFVLRLLIK